MPSDEPSLQHGAATSGLDAELVGEVVLRSIARDLLLDGDVDPGRVTLAELRAAARSELKEILATGQPLQLVRDYEDGLLDEARRHATGNADFAVVFYTTFVEHRINGMLAERLRKSNHDDRAVVDIVRKNIADKTGAVWRAEFNTPFPERLRQAILRLAGERNEFVHYKWRPVPNILASELLRRQAEILELSEWAVSELDLLQRASEPLLSEDVANWLFQ